METIFPEELKLNEGLSKSGGIKMFMGLSEDVLRKIGNLFNNIEGAIILKSDKEVLCCQEELNAIYQGVGTIQFAYAKRVLTAYDFALNRYHADGKTLLEKILEGKKIYLSSFKEKGEEKDNDTV